MQANSSQHLDYYQFLTDEQSDRRRSGQLRISKQGCTILLRRYQQELFQRCKYRLGNTEDAEDALQETLLRAYRAVDGFAGKSSFRTWLYAIADNQCNTVASRRMRHQLSEHVCALIEIHEQSSRYQEAFEDCAQVNSVLDEIPAKAKQILKMRFYAEFSLDEIAQNLGIGLSAAKMRLYRALDTFEQQFRDSGLATSNGIEVNTEARSAIAGVDRVVDGYRACQDRF